MRGVLLPHLHRINEQIRGSTVVLSPPRRRVGTAGSGSGWMGNSRLRPVGGFSSRFLPVVVHGGDETACSCIIGVIASYSWVKISPFDFYRRGKLRHQEKCIMHVLHLWFCTRSNDSKANESLHFPTTNFVISSFDSSFTIYQYWKWKCIDCVMWYSNIISPIQAYFPCKSSFTTQFSHSPLAYVHYDCAELWSVHYVQSWAQLSECSDPSDARLLKSNFIEICVKANFCRLFLRNV